MAKVMKSFRLSESAIAALENRDTQKYRSGQEYIEALLLNQEEKETPTMENLAEDVTELKQDIKQILQLLEQLNQGADKKPKEEKKTVPKTYGGLPYTPPPSYIIQHRTSVKWVFFFCTENKEKEKKNELTGTIRKGTK